MEQVWPGILLHIDQLVHLGAYQHHMILDHFISLLSQLMWALWYFEAVLINCFVP